MLVSGYSSFSRRPARRVTAAPLPPVPVDPPHLLPGGLLPPFTILLNRSVGELRQMKGLAIDTYQWLASNSRERQRAAATG